MYVFRNCEKVDLRIFLLQQRATGADEPEVEEPKCIKDNDTEPNIRSNL